MATLLSNTKKQGICHPKVCGLELKAQHNIQKPINQLNEKLLFNHLVGSTFLFHNTINKLKPLPGK